MQKNVFVSYASNDHNSVSEIVADLKSIPIDTTNQLAIWYDQELVGGQAWWNEILRNILQCHIFVNVISEDSLSSDACHKELSYARDLRKPILPISLDKESCLIAGAKIRELQIVDYSASENKQALKQLQKAFREIIERKVDIPDPLPNPPSIPRDPIGELADQIYQQDIPPELQREIYRKLLNFTDTRNETESKRAEKLLKKLQNHPTLERDIRSMIAAYLGEEKGSIDSIDGRNKTGTSDELKNDSTIGFVDKRLELALQQIRTGNSLTMIAAIKVLRQYPCERSFTELVELLSNRDKKVAIEAKKVALSDSYLNQLSSHDVDLRKILSETQNQGTLSKMEFLKAISRQKNESYFIDLITSLADQNEIDVKNFVITELGKFGDARATEYLLPYTKETSSNTRNRVESSLRLLADKHHKAKSLIDKTVDIDFELGDSKSILWELCLYFTPQTRDLLVSMLIEAIRNPDLTQQKREYSLRILGELGRIGSELAVTSLLMELNRKGKFYGFEQMDDVVWVLGRSKSQLAVSPLRKYLSVSNQKAQAIWSLAQIGDEGAIPEIGHSFNFTDSRFLDDMIDALVQIGGAKSVEALVEHLYSDTYSARPERILRIRTKIVWGIAQIDTPTAVEAIVQFLDCTDESIRSSVMQELAKLDTPTAHRALKLVVT